MGILHLAPWLCLPPVFPCLPPPSFVTFPQNKGKKKKERENKSILWCPYIHWGLVKLLGKLNPPPQPCREPSTVESYTSASITILCLVLLDGFLSGLSLFGWGGVEVEVVTEVFGVPLSQLCICSFLAFTVSRSTDPGLPHGSGNSTDHKHPLGLQHQHSLRTAAPWQYSLQASTLLSDEALPIHQYGLCEKRGLCTVFTGGPLQ